MQVVSPFRQNATLTRSVVLSGRRDLYCGRAAVEREFGRLKKRVRACTASRSQP
jgi:hypothetical protein